MSFKYSVIGDNTPENREWLEKIGYENDADLGLNIIVTNIKERYFLDVGRSAIEFYISEGVIDCIGNPQLFRAVTAMKDDSDYMQWFTDGKEWILCFGDSFGKWYYSLGKYLCFSLDTIHKAPLEELINHFKL